jgi:Tfp pilus assembly protein PilF
LVGAATFAKRIESEAEADALFVSQGILDLIDLPLYRYEFAKECALAGDHLPARSLYRLAGFDLAGFLRKPAKELTPGDWFLRGVAKMDTSEENTDEEAICYVNALSGWPDFTEARLNLSVVLYKQGKLRDASVLLKEALGSLPDNPDLHNNYGAILAKQKKTKLAEKHFLAAIRLASESADVHYNYGKLLSEVARRAEAEVEYLESLRLRPDSASAHNNYANLLAQDNRLTEARTHYEEAIRLEPELGEAHYNFALLLGKLNKHSQSETHFREAYRLSPKNEQFATAVRGRRWEKRTAPSASAKTKRVRKGTRRQSG